MVKKMKLYNHQIQALKDSEGLNRVAYYHDMGLGKTFTGAEKMHQLNARVNLVICQKSKINDWVDHFRTYYPKYTVYNLTDKTKAAKRALEYGFWLNYRNGSVIPSVLVINYELAFRRAELAELRDFTLMLDESSLIQNETAKRSKFALKLGEKAANVILLSGTPTSGKYENLWSQMHLLGWNISKRMYWNQYINIEYLDMVGRSIPIVTGYKNVDRLKRKMRDYGCQFLKTDEVFDLPEQIYQTITIDTTKEYRMFKKNGIVTFNDPYDVENAYTLVGDTTLTKMLYERMLCSSYNPAKYEAFEDLLNSTEDNFIVFYNFNDELKNLITVANASGREYGVINGQGQKNVNYSLNHNYVLFIQYQAGARGGNYQSVSNRLIFHSLPLSSELFEQSKKRIHRIGQEKTCFYYLLLCRNSIEEKILATLEKRQDYTAALFERG